MQPVSRSRSIAMVGIFGLVVALVALAGCSLGVPAGIPGTGPLVTVQTRGGMCADGGMCDATVILERDGRVHGATKPPNDLGRVGGAGMAAITAAIQSTDFVALTSKPFTGECPIAFDGQELIFEFATAGGTQRLASCEVDIDWGQPLFVTTGAALGEWVAIPLT